jgi:hypothetical protein
VPPVLIHSSWRGIIAAYLSMLVLVIAAVVAVSGAGLNVATGILVLIALVVCAIVVFDYPIATSFGPDGVERRCLLRRERLSWDRIEALTRTSDSTGLAPGEGSRWKVSRRPGGLVAVIGRRRYLLVNQCESQDECRTLRDGLYEWTDDPIWVAGLPEDDQPPTWLYRRRHHRPPTG